MPSLLSSVRQGRQEGRAAKDETIINATIEIITLFTAHRSGSVDDCIRSHKPLDFSCKFSFGWNSLIIPRSCSSSRFRLSTIQQQSNVVAGRGRRFVCWLFQVVRYSLPSSSCRPQQTSFVGFFHSNSNSVLFFLLSDRKKGRVFLFTFGCPRGKTVLTVATAGSVFGVQHKCKWFWLFLPLVILDMAESAWPDTAATMRSFLFLKRFKFAALWETTISVKEEEENVNKNKEKVAHNDNVGQRRAIHHPSSDRPSRVAQTQTPVHRM